MEKKGFTLMELLVVVVIVGITAAFGASQYNAAKEKALDNEAQANLRLILAAERMFRMESNNSQYIACGNAAAINTNLRLSIPVTNPAWFYCLYTRDAGTNFCAQAERAGGSNIRSWFITTVGGVADPQPTAANDALCPPCM